MTAKNEEYRQRLRDYRMKIGLIALVAIEVPLILLLFFLNSFHVIDYSVFSLGLMAVGMGGLLISLAISDWWARRKLRREQT